MAGKTTYHSRLQEFVDLAGGHEATSSEELIQMIMRRSPPSFVYHRWDPDRQETVAKCSETAVRRTLDLACDLGLFDSQKCELTNAGEEAADLGRFDNVLRRRLRVHFRQLGCSVDDIERMSVAMLHRKPTVFPTVNVLFDEACEKQGLDISPPRFSVLLRLLAQSGGLCLFRRHIYLPVK